METGWFSKIVAHHPYAILVAVFVFSSTCLIVPLTIKKFPNFSDPQLGFEARGTKLAQRFTAWKNLLDATGVRGTLVDNPVEYFNYLEQQGDRNYSDARHRTTQGIVRKKPNNEKRKKSKKYSALRGNKTDVVQDDDKDKWEEILELRNKNRLDTIDEHDGHSHLGEDGFFCNAPSSDYARVVLGSDVVDRNMWSMEGVLAQCHIDEALRTNPEFESLCQTYTDHSNGEKRCCRSWSPANYVALLSNRTSCLGVTDSDLSRVEELLKRCSYYYNTNHLTVDCADNVNCRRKVPAECYIHDALYHLLHYLLDVDFLPADRPAGLNHANATLRASMIILPIAASSAAMNFYQALSTTSLAYRDFRVLGMELGLKSTLFDHLLVNDSYMLLIGSGFVTVCIWAYTGSLLLTVATLLAVIFSLGISYAIYTLVLRITFFPFMNLLAIVVAVGIGSDDAFIFCKVWETGKQQKMSTGGLVRLVQETMKHAVPSMFVTSLTTAVAFFASIVSNVTAINCFSLFSGMTVIANFFLMITWLPASVVISEHCRLAVLSPANFVARKIIRPVRLFTEKLLTGLNDFLTRLVIGFRWFWLPTMSAIAIAGCTIVFRYPGLRLPNVPNFPLFDDSHPFEIYDLVYARKFWFERGELDGSETLPLRFVWGVKPIDNGDYLDPSSRGELEWDETFDVTKPESQSWLRQFCQDLRAQPFYRNTVGPLWPNCFVESLQRWMSGRRCEDLIEPTIDRAPCCQSSAFPYSPSVLRRCIGEAMAELHRTPSHLWTRGGTVAGGVKFLKESLRPSARTVNDSASMPLPEIMAFIVEYDSVQPYTFSFAEMDEFYNKVEKWMQEQLLTAPPGLRGGWFVSRLEFYELQRTLYEGTVWAMGFSMFLALAVLGLVTLNLLVSVYAIVAIGAAIVVSVSSLVLLGWKLNVLESVAVSTAIGLATDFSLHYGVCYRACEAPDRIARVKASLQQMAGPSLMAAVTTGAAGAFMLPSHVLAYIQIGIFLILVMCISWSYATFFLCPLLAIVGPSAGFTQFRYPSPRRLFACFGKRGKEDTVETDGQNRPERRRGGPGRGVLSESTLSTSSTVCQFYCGELEGLSTRLAANESLLPSPSSPLLFLDATQVQVTHSRRK